MLDFLHWLGFSMQGDVLHAEGVAAWICVGTLFAVGFLLGHIHGYMSRGSKEV